MTPTADRLSRLAGQLGETPAQVAATLHAELVRALAEIDAGMARGDRPAVADATHAARNSVLMLSAPGMLAALRTLGDAVLRDDRETAAAARAGLETGWRALSGELSAAMVGSRL